MLTVGDNLWAVEDAGSRQGKKEAPANMCETIARVDEAIELNLKGHQLRMQEVPLKLRLLAAFEQDIAYNYNTANDHETALSWFERSRDNAIAASVQEGRGEAWSDVTKKNMARCLLYLGQDDKAWDLLDIPINGPGEEGPVNWALFAAWVMPSSSLLRDYSILTLRSKHTFHSGAAPPTSPET